MSNIEQICMELQKADGVIADISKRLERERSEISNSMNKAQQTFGSSQMGQSLVQELFGALNKAVYADDSLHMLRSEITQSINKLRK